MNRKETTLGKIITTIRNGLNVPQYDEPTSSEMLPISRIETISEGVIDFQRVKYARLSESQRRRYELQSGDILFSHINSPEHIAKTGLYRHKQPLIHGVNLLLLRPNVSLCHPEYLSYYLKSEPVRRWYRSRCKKAVNQASLNQQDVTELSVSLPPLTEQQRIAEILSRADRLRRLRRFALEMSDGYLQAVFLEMFGDPVTNPMGWNVVPLGSAFLEKPQIGTAKPAHTGGKQLLIRVGEIGDYEVASEKCASVTLAGKELERFSVKPGDFLLARAIGSVEHLGKSSIVQSSSTPVVYDSHVMRLRFNSETISPIFFRYWLRSRGGRARFMQQAGRTAVQFNVNSKQIANVKIPLPPSKPQIEFVKTVLKYQRLRVQQRESLRQTEHLFQALLQSAFRGELTPP